MSNMLTVQEVAEKLNISEQTVYKYIRTGQLPVTRFGTKKKPRIRINEDDFYNFIT